MTNRAAVKRRIADDIAPHALQAVDLGVEGRTAEMVPVAYGSPSDEDTETAMWFARLAPNTGRLDPTAMHRNSPRMDDSFTIAGTIQAFGFDNVADAEEACERILNQFRSVLDRCQALLDRTDGQPTPDGVPDGSDPSKFKVARAYVGDWSMTPYQPVGDTHVASIDFTIECLTANT